MSISRTEQHLIENEMIFRRKNERVVEALDELDAMHIADGNGILKRENGEDLELDFKCECADENCTERISMPLSEYQSIHKKRDRFIVLPSHQVDAIEEVLKKTDAYVIVKKNNLTDEPTGGLNTTPIRNV